MRWQLLPTGLIVILTACSSVPKHVEENPAFLQAYQERLSHLQGVDNWSLDGRLAINDGRQGGSGNFSWVHDHNVTRMSFRGAFGKGAWKLLADGSGAHLELADGSVHHASSLSQLVKSQIGWRVPVDALSWWVKGLSYPRPWESRVLDENGQLRKLLQYGWEVNLDNYREQAGFSMPAKLTARNGDYTVKLVVSNWRVTEEGVVID